MKTKPLNFNILARTLACSLLLLMNNITSAGTIAQSPLFVTSSLDPNIMFIIDDSGSMKNSFVPDSLCGSRTTKQVYSSTVNGLAYNPNTTYSAPLDSNGLSLGDSPFTAAWKDGFALPHPTSGTVAAGGARVNLVSQYQPTWSAGTTGCNDSTEYNGTAQAAYYYKYTPGITGCNTLATTNTTNDNCYTKIVVSTTSGPGNTDERQNFANWYTYYRTRILTTKAGASRAFAQLDASPRVGYGNLNKASSSTVDGLSVSTIVRGVRAFSGTDRQAYFTWLFALPISTYTPTRRALDAAGSYYSNSTSTGPWSTTPGTSGGTLYSCRQSYTILMTDGYWNDAEAATVAARSNNDGSTANNATITDATNTISFTYTPVSPFRDTYSDTLADVAMYYWKRDLCPTLANNVPISAHDPAFWQHMVTYGIGLGVPTQVSPTVAFDAITTGASISWPDPQVSNTNAGSPPASRIDDLLHAGVNGHGGFLNAEDTNAFVTALKSTLTAITDTTRTSASAAAANSTSLQGDTLLYVAKFKPVDWYGTLQALPVIQATGAIDTLNPNWEASAKLPAATNRNIFTLNPGASIAPHGIPFQWTSLTTTQQGYLNKLNATATPDGNGEKRLNWLRGDTSLEKRFTGGIFRNRTGLLGDIVDSNPIYVGTTDYGYGLLPSPEGSAYAAFLASTSYKARIPTLYVGANDGMLHAFNATKNANATDTGPGGVELFAYVPNVLFPELSKLTDPNYVHQYYVDGTNGIGDAYFDGAWHTMLAGVTGAGGQAVFALDITDPGNFTSSNVLWEFTSANDGDLGYTIGQPNIIRTNDEAHPWVVLVNNGYNSNNGHAVLFMLDAKTGSLVKKIDTGSAGSGSNKNGLSTPLAVDTNSDTKIDVVYAGDLNGNMWKFNLSATSAATWDVAFSAGGVKLPLFVACSTTGTSCTAANRQPITGKPGVGAVGTDQAGGYMIYFGTGKYFETGDGTIAANPQVESFYGIWDQNLTVTDRANLQEQTIIFEGFATTNTGAQTANRQRVLSQNPVCYSITSPGCTANNSLKKGWAINLLESGVNAKGERVVTRPLVRMGVVIFTTMIPDPDPCTGGGTGWIMLVNALTGGRSDAAQYDTNGDSVVNSSDLITANGNKYAASGLDPRIGLLTSSIVIEGTPTSYLVTNAANGTNSVGIAGNPPPPSITPTGTPPPTPPPSGRQSWRQLR